MSVVHPSAIQWYRMKSTRGRGSCHAWLPYDSITLCGHRGTRHGLAVANAAGVQKCPTCLHRLEKRWADYYIGEAGRGVT